MLILTCTACIVSIMAEKGIHFILKNLQKEVGALREEVESLKESDSPGLSELRGMLRRRGLAPYLENPIPHTIFSSTLREKEKGADRLPDGRKY